MSLDIDFALQVALFGCAEFGHHTGLDLTWERPAMLMGLSHQWDESVSDIARIVLHVGGKSYVAPLWWAMPAVVEAVAFGLLPTPPFAAADERVGSPSSAADTNCRCAGWCTADPAMPVDTDGPVAF